MNGYDKDAGLAAVGCAVVLDLAIFAGLVVLGSLIVKWVFGL